MPMIDLDWTSFVGSQSTQASGPPGQPSVAVAPFKCPCCDDREIVIGIAGDNGVSVSVGLPVETAYRFAQSIIDTFTRLTGERPAGSAVQ